MTIDANLLYGLELGFGIGLVVGLIVGALLMFAIGNEVKLPW